MIEMAKAIREELVPVLIVGVLLGLYAYQTVSGATVTADLQTLVAMVTAFYFGSRGAEKVSGSIRRTAAAIVNGAGTSGKGSDGPADG